MAAVSVPFLSPGPRRWRAEEDVSFESVSDLYTQINEPSLQAMELDENAVPEGKSAVRSCTTCSKAKAKCVKRPGQTICER